MNKNVSDVTPETLEVLSRYEWPGNVRELRNVIERAIVVARGNVIEVNDLSFPFSGHRKDDRRRLAGRS